MRPTRVRWKILVWLAVIAGLTYLDRLNLSIAGKHIQDEFAFGTQTMGWILSAFVLGYALFQVPGGWLGDRFGPRNVLTVAIVAWSLATAATALAPRLPVAEWLGLAWSFMIVRFFVGVGEAMAFPNINRMIAFWMEASRRGIGNSLFLVGIGAGGTLAPLFVSRLAEHWGWRTSFYACAGIGAVVALGWHLYAANRPAEHPSVNAAELERIGSGGANPHGSPVEAPGLDSHPAVRSAAPRTPWRTLFASSSVWSLVLSYIFIAYPAYIYYTWFFIYLVRVRGFTVMQGGFWGATPFLAIMLLAPVGGWVSDRAAARWGKRRGRQSAVWLGVACSAALLWAGAHTENNALAIPLLAAASGFNLFATATWWATCNDLTRNFSGTLSGLMNMFGNLGGWLSPILTAYLASHFGWTAALDFAVGMTLAAGALWFGVNAGQTLEPSENRSAGENVD